METLPLVLGTIFAPLLGFLIAILLLINCPRVAQTVVLAGSALSVAGSAALLIRGPVDPVRFLWFTSGDIELRFGFLLDGVSLVFGVAVALITFCVMVYSLGYMSGDPSRTRYFAMLGFFAWSMLGFVYAVDLLQSFIFWELIGLASFFLIGFWYEKPSAAAAAKKAFLMTRVGDVGLFIGILTILQVTGDFDIPRLLDPDLGLVGLATPAMLTAITLLIFLGIVGKSAQFPLHTWLPDAMEGPTPVSALLHSATMVAAGVFLMARLFPLFMAAETTRTVILCIATFTALLSATMAMVDRDIKKVLAYSSISQLSFMLMALAAGALFAGYFHLITHAIFKALLFLCSGLYIHHLETNDMEEIGRRGGRRMPFATIGLVIGGAALAGIPPLGGFFSKEEIFAQLGRDGFTVFTAGAFAAAFLTAYYTFRMIFLVTVPERTENGEEPTDHGEHGSHAGEPWSMGVPVAILALGAMVIGFAGPRIAAMLGVRPEEHAFASMIPAVAVVLAGVAVAWLDFGRGSASPQRRGFIARVPALHTLFSNQWYVDDLYRAVLVRFTNAVATLLHAVETRGLDGGFNRLGLGVLGLGVRSTRVQGGWVQFYSGCAIIFLGAIAFYIGAR
ncbi:MAG: NADH-quinone oxidoreductase subunit L [Gemmatimonadetes bacterium]|jgi:NADH-quinone oxidoreductase subunit L|nr:NADH-quinone oxidoreductase subunit L [Gemmatimonadota bacterium]